MAHEVDAIALKWVGGGFSGRGSTATWIGKNPFSRQVSETGALFWLSGFYALYPYTTRVLGVGFILVLVLST